MPAAEMKQWQDDTARLADRWARAAERGIRPDSDEAQELAARHVAWLRAIPGTPASEGGDVRGYVLGLADMYVADAGHDEAPSTVVGRGPRCAPGGERR